MLKLGAVDSTVVAKGKLEVRGGTLTITKGTGNKPSLEIGADTLVIGPRRTRLDATPCAG